MTLDYQAYIKNYYVPLEEHLVTCYVQRLSNLGAYSTQYGESNNQAIKNSAQATMSMQKSFAAIKKYTLEQCDTILSVETNSFAKGAMYVAQMQKDIKDNKPPFGRCINLGISL